MGPPLDELSVREAESSLGFQVPAPLRELYRTGDGRFDRAGWWWVIWPLERTVAESVSAWREGRLPADLLGFGDDGTGNPFCLPTRGRDEVLRWSWIDSSVEKSEGTFAEFLDRWVTEERGRRP